MKTLIIKFNLFLLVNVLFISCGSGNNSQSQEASEDGEQRVENDKDSDTPKSSEDFNDFYTKFLKDEQFQLSRIEFPLEGEIVEDGKEIYEIEKKDWNMLIGSIYDVDRAEYQVEIKEGPTDVFHRIYIDGSGVDIISKYKLIDTKWYLVYYKSIFI